MTFKSLFGQITILSLCLVNFRVSRFHVSHLTHETFKLCLQNTLNMSKATRVYFGALQVGAACGNDSSFTSKTDLSVTDGINSEHKQEQLQSTKDAGSARRHGQQTSWHVRSDASQHERGGGPPPHKPMHDRRVRATHQADTTPTGGTTSSGRSQLSSS